MSRIKIVMQETLKNHLKSGTFWAMILLPIVFGVISGLAGYFAAAPEDSHMGIVASEDLKTYFDDDKYKFVNEDELETLVEEKEISSYAKVREENGQIIADFNEADASMVEILKFQEIINNIQNQLNSKNAGLDQNQAQILAKTPLINQITDEKSENKFIGQAIYFVLIFLMYMVLMSFVNLVLAEIATEKGTKMIEFIFSSVKPGDYFAGKMLGNFIAVFVQIFTYVIFAIIGYFIAKSKGLFDNLDLNFALTSESYGMIAEIVLLFIFRNIYFPSNSRYARFLCYKSRRCR